jgi:hypothetical protein
MAEKHITGLTVVAVVLALSTFASIAEANDPYQPKMTRPTSHTLSTIPITRFYPVPL